MVAGMMLKAVAYDTLAQRGLRDSGASVRILRSHWSETKPSLTEAGHDSKRGKHTASFRTLRLWPADANPAIE
jgi:hypothetical protein